MQCVSALCTAWDSIPPGRTCTHKLSGVLCPSLGGASKLIWPHYKLRNLEKHTGEPMPPYSCSSLLLLLSLAKQNSLRHITC